SASRCTNARLSYCGITGARFLLSSRVLSETGGPRVRSRANCMMKKHDNTGRDGFRATLAVLFLAAAPAAPAIPYTFVNIADTSGPFADFPGGDVALNAGGTVAFTAPLKAGGQGVFTGTGGPVTTIADTSGP